MTSHLWWDGGIWTTHGAGMGGTEQTGRVLRDVTSSCWPGARGTLEACHQARVGHMSLVGLLLEPSELRGGRPWMLRCPLCPCMCMRACLSMCVRVCVRERMRCWSGNGRWTTWALSGQQVPRQDQGPHMSRTHLQLGRGEILLYAPYMPVGQRLWRSWEAGMAPVGAPHA